jgi:hypothetical protein
MATVGEATEIEMILFVSNGPRWPRQVEVGVGVGGVIQCFWRDRLVIPNCKQ